MADDLDDEWWLDSTEKNTEGKAEYGSDAEDSDSNPNEVEDEKEDEKGNNEENIKKRKLDESDDDSLDKPDNLAEGDESNMKEKKKKKKKRKTITDELKNKTPERAKPADLINALRKHYEGKLAAVEQDDIDVHENHFAVSSELDDTASSYLKSLLPKWTKKCKAMGDGKGAPLVLIVCPAALRATQLNRDIADFKGEKCKTAKLFAKHLKLKDQTAYLNKNKIQLGIGTPNRILSLLDADVLYLSQVSHIVLDWRWRDVKQRRMVDIPEIRTDLFQLLKKHVIPKMRNEDSKMKLALL